MFLQHFMPLLLQRIVKMSFHFRYQKTVENRVEYNSPRLIISNNYFQVFSFNITHAHKSAHIQARFLSYFVFVWIQTILGSFLLLKCARITQ